MPEGPEVTLTAQIINHYYRGQILTQTKFLGGRYQRSAPEHYHDFELALPAILTATKSKGKFIYFRFTSCHDKKTWWIWNTLGLTGNWTSKRTSYPKFQLNFQNAQLYFNDSRNFGTLKFSDSKASLRKKLEMLAPDFLQQDVDISAIRKMDQILVKILMNQCLIGSGIGNYLVAEILYCAKLSPWRQGTSLTAKETARLKYSIDYTIKLAYLDNNTGYMRRFPLANIATNSAFRKRNFHPHIDLQNAKFQFRVYRQKFDEYGNEVVGEKIITQGKTKRTTYWVPKIQH